MPLEGREVLLSNGSHLDPSGSTRAFVGTPQCALCAYENEELVAAAAMHASNHMHRRQGRVR